MLRWTDNSEHYAELVDEDNNVKAKIKRFNNEWECNVYPNYDIYDIVDMEYSIEAYPTMDKVKWRFTVDLELCLDEIISDAMIYRDGLPDTRTLYKKAFVE